MAETIGPIMSIMQQAADLEIKRGLAKGLETKGLPALPSWIFIPSSWADMFSGWFTSGSTVKK